jgi:lysophospholipase L1-like esterase
MDPVPYVALGDSSTIETSVDAVARRPNRLVAALLGVVAILAGCGSADGSPSRPLSSAPGLGTRPSLTPTGSGASVRYVALGDSYTIGTSVAPADSWPEQLVARLPRLALVANLGVNGFTAADVIEVELPQVASLRPEVVSLLIGVNDVVQGVREATYRRNVALILDELVRQVGADHVLVITTPDYTVTPAGGDFGDPATQSAGIRRNNAINIELATARDVAVVDIYDLSLLAATDRSYVAVDGLHPSGRQYDLWVERIAPVVSRMLTDMTPG